jgi:Protein of unknown function (DUF3313)
LRLVGLAISLSMVLAVAQAEVPAEVTEDGLVRVASSRKVGVYRAPEVPFQRYQSIVIAPIPVVFRKTWMMENRDIKPADLERIRGELARSFREELIAELVHRGGYQLTESAGPDTLRVEPYVLNLNIVAPLVDAEARSHTYVRTGNSMKLAVELRDASSTVIVGRIINYVQPKEFSIPQFASKVGNFGEARAGFANTARYTREALNVAKTERAQ